MIVVEGPEEVDAIRKARGNNLSLSVLLAIALGNVFGVSPSCQAKFTPNPETLRESSLKTATDRQFMKLTRKEMLDDARDRLRKQLVGTFRKVNFEVEVDVWSTLDEFFREETVETIMGSEFDRDFVKLLAYFEDGMEKLMLPLSGVFARRELSLREDLVARMRNYIEGERFTNGSKFIKEFIDMCRAQGLGLDDTSRLCLLALIAFVGNLSNVGSWAAYWAVRCPSRLSLIREEINRCVSDAEVENGFNDAQLDPSVLRDECPLLESTLMESLRRTQGSFTFRMVMKDVDIVTASGHRYLLLKDSLIIMAPRKNMNSEKIWDRPYDFIPGRFKHRQLPAVQRRHSDNAAATYKRDNTDSQDLTEEQDLAFRPFGGGKDGCTGRIFASDFLRTGLKDLVMNIDIDIDSDSDGNYPTLVPTTRCLKFRNPPVNDTKGIFRRRERADIATRRENAER